jgi:uncharacterized membrane protein
VPYCTRCGTAVDGAAAYCHHCGAAQGQVPQYVDPIGSISDRTASVLCYIPVFGVIPSIVFLASQSYRRNARVRFDAFQSLYLFVAFLVVSTVLPAFFWFSFGAMGLHGFFVHVLKAAVFICWVYLLVKAAQEQQVHLPVIGDLAGRSAAEQF